MKDLSNVAGIPPLDVGNGQRHDVSTMSLTSQSDIPASLRCAGSWIPAGGRRHHSPAALTPFGEVRTLGAQSGVVAVPGVDHRVVAVPVEHLAVHVAE